MSFVRSEFSAFRPLSLANCASLSEFLCTCAEEISWPPDRGDDENQNYILRLMPVGRIRLCRLPRQIF